MIPGIVAGGMRSPGGGGGGDPYWANVVSLLHFDGSDGSTTFTDQRGVTWTPAGDAQLDTAQKVFGPSSLLLDGSGDFIGANDLSLVLGTGDYTLEFWARRNALTTANILAWSGNNAIYVNSGNESLIFQSSGVNRIVVDSALPSGVWVAIALVRAGSVHQLFVNGVSGGTYAGAVDFVSGSVYIGQRSGSSNRFNGWIDEFRLTKGVARYTSDYTPQIAPFPNS